MGSRFIHLNFGYTMSAKKLGLLKGFAEGTVWSGDGDSRILLPFQDTILEAEFTYTGDLVMSETFSSQGILGASAACLQKEACGFNMTSDNLSWSMLQAATLSTAATRTDPVMVIETITARETDDGGGSPVTTVTVSNTPVTTTADLDNYGLPASGVKVANIDGVQLAATVSGSIITLDDNYSGDAITVQYLRDPLTEEEVIYLGQGQRRENVGVYGRFFGCPGSILIVAPNCAVNPNVSMGVSDGSTASLSIELMCLRTNGYFAEITRLKDCVNC